MLFATCVTHFTQCAFPHAQYPAFTASEKLLKRGTRKQDHSVQKV